MSDCPNCGAPSDGEPCEDCAPPNFALHQSIRQKDDRIRALEAEIAGWWPVKDGLETELRNATSAANAYKDRAEKAEAERDEIVRSRKAFMDGIAAFESMTGFDLENGARRLKDLETADHRVAELEAELSRRVGPGLFELRKDRDMWKARAEKAEAALAAAQQRIRMMGLTMKRAEEREADKEPTVPLITRVWSMPSGETFSITPIKALLSKWLDGKTQIVDPFARNSRIANYRNDLDPETSAESHLEAIHFCQALAVNDVHADAVLFDPPYSPRQISEIYRSIGAEVGMETTQSGKFYRLVRNALDELLIPGGIAISFGWNSAGFGRERGYDQLEILLVAHGGAHNDTICVVERKVQSRLP